MPEPANVTNSDIDRVQLALDHFKSTGQVDMDSLTFAREKFLPSRGLEKGEIEKLGPIELMLKVESVLAKDTPAPPQTENLTQIATSVPNLTTEVEQLSKNLTSQIDEEVKRQLTQGHTLDEAQVDINKLAQSLPTPEPPQKSSEAPNPVPTTSSLDTDLENLKEGDPVGDWTLKRVYSTSFGGKDTPFYELQNERGALWTLNQEEIKSLLKKTKTTPSLPDLQPQPETNLPKKEEFSPPETKTEIPPEVGKQIDPPPEKPAPEQFTAATPEIQPSDKTNLTEAQIKFLRKMAKDKEAWETLLTFNPKTWLTFWDAVNTGHLGEIGLGAGLVEEKLHDKDASSIVTVEKGDNFEKLLQKTGLQITGNANDSVLLGTHLLLNYDLLEKTRAKIADSGITINPLVKEEEVLELTRKAKLSGQDSYDRLKEALNFLPVAGHFKVIKKESFAEIEKLLS